MNQRATSRYLLPLLSITILAPLVGCGGVSSSTPPPPPDNPIKHIILLAQENRSFDH